METTSIVEVLPTVPVTILAGIVGLVVGSFLNVIIHRVPRSESIVLPASRCPQCKSPIRPWENIPILSYLLLQGRCKSCGWPIKPRYPIVEFLGGTVAVVAFLRFGFTWDGLGCLLLGWHLIALGVIDLETRTIPDQIVLPLALGGLLLAFLRGGVYGLLEPILTGLMAATFFLLIYLVARFVLRKKEAIGGGDVTMSVAFAFYLTPMLFILTLMLSAMLALMATLIYAYTKGASREELSRFEIPFGTALAVGAWVVYTFGATVVQWIFQIAAKLVHP